MEFSLKQFDLNLLVTLREIIRTKSVSETAKSLGVTQPAVSNSLARLRSILDDQILVRAPKGYVLTTRAEQIDRPLCNALSHIQETLKPQPAFDPRNSKRRFTIAMSDYSEVAFAPAFISAFRQLAPDCLLGIRRLPNYTPIEELTQGELDMCCCFAVDPAPGLMVRRLYTDRFVSIMRSGHPDYHKKMTLETFLTLDHALVSPIIENPDTEFEGLFDDNLEKVSKKKRRVMVSVPHFYLAAATVQRLDLVMTGPERIVNAYKDTMGFRVFETPLEMPAFQTNLLWHERNNNDPGLLWLRELMIKTVLDETKPA